MKSFRLRSVLALPFACLLALVVLPIPSSPAEEPFDVARAKAVMTKFKAGETLTPDEQTYLQRVREEIQKRNQGNNATAAAPVPVNAADWSSLIPITELTTPYKGEDGGL